MSLSSLLSKCHDQSFQMGWWSDCPPQDHPSFRWYICTKLCLIHSEIDEACAPGNDDHLPHRKAFEVEIADAAIRTLDLLGFLLRHNPTYLFAWQAYEADPWVYPAEVENDFLLGLHMVTSRAMEAFRKGNVAVAVGNLGALIDMIDMNQSAFGLHIEAAMLEKLAYNAKRADHQLVNRQADGGKSF